MNVLTDMRNKLDFHVVFSAHMTLGHRPWLITMKQNDTLHFPVVTINEGGGYDSETSTFTAPIAGVYRINLSVQKFRSYSMYLNVLCGSKSIINVFSIDITQFENVSKSAIVKLSAGDECRVSTYHQHYRVYLAANNHENINSFSGYLMHV